MFCLNILKIAFIAVTCIYDGQDVEMTPSTRAELIIYVCPILINFKKYIY